MATETKNLTVESIKKEAQAEINKEVSAKYVVTYKAKLRELSSAQQIVSNIQRELANLELKMEQELE